jgi:hypothetical protein
MSRLVVAIFANRSSSFLAEAIDSALASTDTTFDLVVVVNNCEGANRSILEASLRNFTTNEVVRLIWGGFGTLGAVRARAIKGLEYEFIAMLDSDDLVVPSRFSKQLEFLEDNPRVGVVGSDLVLIDSQGGRLGSRKLPRRIRVGTLLLRSPLATPSVMFRREAYLSAGGFSDMHYCEDFELWVRMSRDWEIANIGEPLTLYRQHPGQISSSGRLNQAICRVNAVALNLGLPGPYATSIESALGLVRNMPMRVRLRLGPSFLLEAPIPRLQKVAHLLRCLL